MVILKRRFVWLTVALAAGATCNSVIFFGQERFRAPLDTLLLTGIGVGLYQMVAYLKQKSPATK